MRSMRRLKQTRLRPFLIRPRTVTISTSSGSEGVPIISWGDPVTFYGEVWPATSQRQVEQYGDRISGIQNMRIEGEYDIEVVGSAAVIVFENATIKPGDGVHVYAAETDEPDYVVLSFTQYGPLRLEIEHRV